MALPIWREYLQKIVYGNGNARDLLALANSLKRTPIIKDLLKNANSPLLSNVGTNLDTVDDVSLTLTAAIADEPPFSVREGGMIRKGYDAQLDSLRQMKNSGTGILSSIEETERERTGIKQLKISYNKVFGYYIEVSKPIRTKFLQTTYASRLWLIVKDTLQRNLNV